MKDLLKEVWKNWIPKLIKGVYNIFLRPQPSAVWIACILFAYCLIFNVGGPIIKLLSLLEVIVTFIVYWQYKGK